MKLYVDQKGDRHYVVTDDGESVYVEELEEDGRITEHLEETIDAAERRRRRKPSKTLGVVELETFGSE